MWTTLTDVYLCWVFITSNSCYSGLTGVPFSIIPKYNGDTLKARMFYKDLFKSRFRINRLVCDSSFKYDSIGMLPLFLNVIIIYRHIFCFIFCSSTFNILSYLVTHSKHAWTNGLKDTSVIKVHLIYTGPICRGYHPN